MEFYKSPFTNVQEVENDVTPIDIDLFAQQAKNEFEMLTKVSANSPEGKALLFELKSFGEKGLADAISFLRLDIGLTNAASRRLISEVPNIKPIFDSTLLRIKQETGYFDFSQGEQVSLSLLFRLKGRSLRDFIFFFSPDSWILKINYAKGFHSNMFPGLVVVENNLPKDREMLEALTTSGTLPELITTLNHELVHKKQYSLPDRWKVIGLTLSMFAALIGNMNRDSLAEQLLGYTFATGAILLQKRFSRNKFLSEVHAHIAGSDTPYLNNVSSGRPDRVIGTLEYYRSFEGLPSAVHAYNLIRALRLLGVADNEIGEIIKRDKFDKKHKFSYPNLSNALKQRVAELAIKPRETEILINCIFIKHQLDIITQRNLAKIIAMQELQRETGSINWESGSEWLRRFGKLK